MRIVSTLGSWRPSPSPRFDVVLSFRDGGLHIEALRQGGGVQPESFFLDGDARDWGGRGLPDWLAGEDLDAPHRISERLLTLWDAWRAGCLGADELRRQVDALLGWIDDVNRARPDGRDPAPSADDHVLFPPTEENFRELHLTLEGRRAGRWAQDEAGCARALERCLDRYDPVLGLTVSSTVLHTGSLMRVEQVLAERRPPLLRLRLGALTFPDHHRGDQEPQTSGGDGASWRLEVFDLTQVVASLPTLTDLTVQANGVALGGSASAPNLARLVLRMESLEGYPLPEGWNGLSTWHLPVLEALEIWPGDLAFGWGETDASVLRPLLDSPLLPALRRLRIMTDVADDLVSVLADGPLLPRLNVLDLRNGALTDHGAELLLSRWERFSHLHRLELGGNLLTREAAGALDRHRAVNIGSQRWSAGVPRCDPRPVSLLQGWNRAAGK